VAALAAGKQNHFWDYTELFYRQQGTEGTGYVNDSYLAGLAGQVPGLNLSTWRTGAPIPRSPPRSPPTRRRARPPGSRARRRWSSTGLRGQSVAPSGVPSYSDLQQAIKTVT